jgi:putative transposase
MGHEMLFGSSVNNAEEDPMARPKSMPLRDTLVKFFPAAIIMAMARSVGATIRQRKVDIVIFIETLVLGFSSGRNRTIAQLRRTYERATNTTIEESSFYDRFNKGLVKLLKTMASEAFGKLDGLGRELTGPLAVFRDLIFTDSTVMRLHDLLEKTYRGSRTNHSKAALKMHAIMSVLGKGANSIKLTEGRRHDGPVFRVGKWVRDRLLIFDLGYFNYQLFSCITRNQGYFISRLKGCANPLIVSQNIKHRGRAVTVVGSKLRTVLSDLSRQTLDVMAEVPFKHRAYAGKASSAKQLLRVVGVRDPVTGEYHLYMTNIPVERLTAEEVAQVYAARWEIELLFKELKSYYRIADLPSRKQEVVEALLYAAVLTLALSRRLLAEVRRKLKGMAKRLPEQRWAAIFSEMAKDLLTMLTYPRNETRLVERSLIRTMLHEAVDPNVSRLSLLESIETRNHRYAPKAA